MTITIESVETIALRIPYDHWAPKPTFGGIERATMDCLLVRVTASNGLVGWGEAFWGGWQATQAAIDNWIAPLARRAETSNDLTISARFERALHNFGRTGPYVYAIAGLDFALWDLRGKLEGVPVHALLGEKKRDARRGLCLAARLRRTTSTHVKRNTARALERGYRQIKLHEKTAEAVAATRETAGPDVPIMVDTNCAWLPEAAHDAVMAMKPYDPLWVEEPIWPAEDVDVARQTAQGDRRRRSRPARTRPARSNSSGLRRPASTTCSRARSRTASRRMWEICRRAESDGATCVPHRPISVRAIWRRCMCSPPRRRRSRWNASSAISATCPTAGSVPIENGAVQIPDMPGLGPDPDEELMRFRV